VMCRVLLHTFLMRFGAFWSLRDVVLVRFYAFCCTIFVRDILIRCDALLGGYELFLAVKRYLDEISCCLAAGFFVLMVGCKEVGEVDVEGCRSLRVYDGLLDVAWFCTRWVVRWRRMNVSGVVVVGESTIALEDRRVCVEVV
jgi:hypothetical protein